MNVSAQSWSRYSAFCSALWRYSFTFLDSIFTVGFFLAFFLRCFKVFMNPAMMTEQQRIAQSGVRGALISRSFQKQQKRQKLRAPTVT